VSFLPKYRRVILAIFPTAFFLRNEYGSPKHIAAYAGVLCLAAVLFLAIRRWPNAILARRPVLSLLTGFSAVIVAASIARNADLWIVLGTFSSYVWFIAYALTDRNAVVKKDGTLELATFGPAWGSTHTPYPKGAAYLRKIEAQSAEQFARVRLKGLKLITWALILRLLNVAWFQAFHVYMHIPPAAQALHFSVIGHPVAWHVRWESQILEFFEDILTLSVSGHVIIACCRVAGFDALRNTYRPLSATTIAEFFNRYYYYYKELVVDFFFYPAFFRYFKRQPKVRLVFATFSAACFGNVFFHFTRDWTVIQDKGLLRAISNYQCFAFYCFALALMLSISQLRKKNVKPTGILRGHVLPAVRVCFLFCLLNVFTIQNDSLVAHFKYLASLFFIHF
jgi:hypothetical protein